MIKRNQKTIDDLKKKMSLGVQKAGFYLETKIKQKAKDENVYDTGDYIRSTYSKEITKYKVRVGNSKTYSRVVENGRKPGKYPPFDALVGWVARKFSLPGKTSSYENADPKVKSIVFLVARKIKRKGIKAKAIFSKTIEEERDKLVGIFISAFK